MSAADWQRQVKSALAATAYHEAGHFVLAWAQGIAVHRIEITVRTGLVVTEPISLEALEEPDRRDQRIRVCLAGGIAQRRFNPRSLRRCHIRQDNENAFDFACSEDNVQARLDRLEAETEAIVKQLWPLIEALAGELIVRRRMTGDEAVQFIDLTATEKMIAYRDHWRS